MGSAQQTRAHSTEGKLLRVWTLGQSTWIQILITQLSAMRPWANPPTTLCLSFLTCKRVAAANRKVRVKRINTHEAPGLGTQQAVTNR